MVYITPTYTSPLKGEEYRERALSGGRKIKREQPPRGREKDRLKNRYLFL